MDAFFEGKKEAEAGVTFGRNCDHLFLPHFHINIEILVVRHGGYEVTIDGVSYLVKEGDIAFFDSYCIHSYDRRFFTDAYPTDDCVLTIPSKYFAPYDRIKENRSVLSPVFHAPDLVDFLLKIVDEIFSVAHNDEVYSYAAKFVLSMIAERLQYAGKPLQDHANDERDLVYKCLNYIRQNYLGDCSRKQLAKISGYSESHISHVFSKYVKIGIPAYVNKLKLEHVKNTIENDPDKNITEIILSCGFNNVQTYYSCLKKYNHDPVS